MHFDEHISLGIDLGAPMKEIYISNRREDVDKTLKRGFKIIHSPENEMIKGSYLEGFWVLAGIVECSIDNAEDQMIETREIFEGMSFKYPPAPKEDYVNAYDEYVRRCSS